MIQLVWSSRFIKAFKRVSKKKSDLIVNLSEILKILENDPFHPSLRTHKLKGSLSDCWASSIDYDYRLIFEIHKFDDRTEILLLSVGTHDEVY